MITKRKWFKFVEILEPNYLSEHLDQTEKDMKDAFSALLNNDLTELESRWGYSIQSCAQKEKANYYRNSLFLFPSILTLSLTLTLPAFSFCISECGVLSVGSLS